MMLQVVAAHIDWLLVEKFGLPTVGRKDDEAAPPREGAE